jgi:hypothetical protein
LRPPGDATLWLASSATAIALHVGLAAGLIASAAAPAPTPPETRISVMAMPSGAVAPKPAERALPSAVATSLRPERADAERLEAIAPQRQEARQRSERLATTTHDPQSPAIPTPTMARRAEAEPASQAATGGTTLGARQETPQATSPVAPEPAATAGALRVEPTAPANSSPGIVRSAPAGSMPLPSVTEGRAVASPAAPARVAAAPPAAAPRTEPSLASGPPATAARPVQPTQRVPAASGAPRGDQLALAPVRPAPPIAEDRPERYPDVLDFLRRYPAGSCFVVLPSARPGGLVGLDGFARDAGTLAGFMDSFQRVTAVEASARLDAVSSAQCRALSFARTLPAYPGFSLYFDMPVRELRSGERLAGTIRNVDGRPLHLLLVDDEGKVQSVDGFVEATGAEARFGAHMTLTGGPVATRQLLLALAGEEPLETVAQFNGAPADLFFAELAEEIARRGLSPDIAIAAFSVR